MAKTSMSATKSDGGEALEFDYILSPSIAGFLFPLLAPSLVFLLPFILVSFFPNMLTSVGINVSKWTLLLGGLLLATINIGIQEIRRRSKKLKLHIDYLVFSQGIFFTSMEKIFIQDIMTTELTKSIFERIFNLGTIKIATAGTDGYEIELKGYTNPDEIVKYISVHRKEGE
ncbi:MAG: PH domain-containing protein [Synergistaceae bacterium]|uniref:PH domain-containing protein n=1 Tax=Aminivibrio sp. TaxID=1872489 RepID=UPI002A1D1DB5|nr:PH domain-containing protein [Synergistaceae bacterium]MDD3390401.1 PH domain-containing protein [Synergistaceae bacterium]MDD3689393.1 PH domain-containing protein [Synergistaceae bacterium]MDD4021684.1 PH domain-containing protein [Synergistaceae bacterium]MDD4612698.1 PH domain-containing protein [Synergistaceae bacterium]